MRGNAGGSSAGTPRPASRARAARRFSGPELSDPAGSPPGDQDGSQQARTSAAHHVCRHGASKQGERSPTDYARWHRGTRFTASSAVLLQMTRGIVITVSSWLTVRRASLVEGLYDARAIASQAVATVRSAAKP